MPLIFTVLIKFLLLFPAIISTLLGSYSTIPGPRDKGINEETLNDHGLMYGRDSLPWARYLSHLLKYLLNVKKASDVPRSRDTMARYLHWTNY